MKLNARAVFPCSPDLVFDTFLDPEFDRRLAETTGVRHTVLSTHTEGSVEVRRLQVTIGRELPTLVAKALGTKNLTYEQINRLDRSAGRLEWTVKIGVIGDKLRCGGTTSCVSAADGGTTRVLDGVVEVRIPLIGGKVESLVNEEFTRSYAQANAIALALLRERGLAA